MEIKLLNEDDIFLTQVTTPWDFTVDGDPSELVRDMAKIMMANNGIGLAAPQVGVGKSIFVMGNEEKLIACINPSIEDTSGEVMDMEGCLSFPKLYLNVRRSETIKVKYFTVTGEEVSTEFSGFMARVFQHEYDHLQGICFVSRVGKLSLELAKKRRKKKSR